MRQIRLTVKKIVGSKVFVQVEALASGNYTVVDSFYVPVGVAEVPVGSTAVVYPDDFEGE